MRIKDASHHVSTGMTIALIGTIVIISVLLFFYLRLRNDVKLASRDPNFNPEIDPEMMPEDSEFGDSSSSETVSFLRLLTRIASLLGALDHKTPGWSNINRVYERATYLKDRDELATMSVRAREFLLASEPWLLQKLAEQEKNAKEVAEARERLDKRLTSEAEEVALRERRIAQGLFTIGPNGELIILEPYLGGMAQAVAPDAASSLGVISGVDDDGDDIATDPVNGGSSPARNPRSISGG